MESWKVNNYGGNLYGGNLTLLFNRLCLFNSTKLAPHSPHRHTVQSVQRTLPVSRAKLLERASNDAFIALLLVIRILARFFISLPPGKLNARSPFSQRNEASFSSRVFGEHSLRISIKFDEQ